MKVAYHFRCGDIEGRYDGVFYHLVFNCLLRLNEPLISSKVLIGDLLLFGFLQKEVHPQNFLNYLFQVQGDIWGRILAGKANYFIEDTVFVICFETIPKEFAHRLHEALIEE
ncbi:hypothetical protein FKX85_19925 [Echinicola soli]|uniref:Uncharacterized protein n=1 Tax=Echinicola soli TaxID=2591634 RepID=A0A514CMW6_9BACT|nr:hypothetical protein [Echinicola soli]QDH81173.1 hypothetical protein FKX85_19925 [Echinicola soli]